MRVLVKFFASYREAVGKHEEEFEILPSSTIKDIINVIGAKYPDIELGKDSILVLNQKIVEDNAELRDGDVIAIFPPVGGG